MQTQNTSNFSGSASNPFSVGMGAGVVNYQISQQLSALKKSTQHCQVSPLNKQEGSKHYIIIDSIFSHSLFIFLSFIL